jgi:hypothetical protein
MPKVPEYPEYVLTMKLVDGFMTKSQEHQEHNTESRVDPVRFAQLSVVALTQVAAIIGVDVGMTLDQFLAVSKANFEQAYVKAPKFS